MVETMHHYHFIFFLFFLFVFVLVPICFYSIPEAIENGLLQVISVSLSWSITKLDYFS